MHHVKDCIVRLDRETKMKWGKFDLIQSIIEEVESINGGF
ncbi:MAG: hypothetical protein A4E67_00238 [Syntrophaceae bacterium PtaB.Bin038]|nr:MAG: hypothetical protein A4E67_00238 [Syntrophaceae bacterium PtaB.Bin038]